MTSKTRYKRSTWKKQQLQQNMNTPHLGQKACQLCPSSTFSNGVKQANLNAHVSDSQTCADVHLQLALLRYDNAMCSVGQQQYQDICCAEQAAPSKVALKSPVTFVVGAVIVALCVRNKLQRGGRNVTSKSGGGGSKVSGNSSSGYSSSGSNSRGSGKKKNRRASDKDGPLKNDDPRRQQLLDQMDMDMEAGWNQRPPGAAAGGAPHYIPNANFVRDGFDGHQGQPHGPGRFEMELPAASFHYERMEEGVGGGGPAMVVSRSFSPPPMKSRQQGMISGNSRGLPRSHSTSRAIVPHRSNSRPKLRSNSRPRSRSRSMPRSNVRSNSRSRSQGRPLDHHRGAVSRSNSNSSLSSRSDSGRQRPQSRNRSRGVRRHDSQEYDDYKEFQSPSRGETRRSKSSSRPQSQSRSLSRQKRGGSVGRSPARRRREAPEVDLTSSAPYRTPDFAVTSTALVTAKSAMMPPKTPTQLV